MNWERIFLRAVPALLVVAGAVVWSLTDASHSGVLGLASISISALMAFAVLAYERGVKSSENKLKEQATSSKGRGLSVRIRSPRLTHEKFDFDNVSVSQLSLRTSELVEASFSGASLRDCDFTKANLSHADFIGALLRESNFTQAMLRSAQLDAAEIQDCTFIDATMEASSWSRSEIDSANFEKADLARAGFSNTTLVDCKFDHAVAADADFSHAVFQSCTLKAVDFSNVDLSHAVFESTSIEDLDLSVMLLDGTLIDSRSEKHERLVTRLLAGMMATPETAWVVDTPAGYIQAVHLGEGEIRCEAVDFDAWPAWRSRRRMTEDMSRKLKELGFTLEEKGNYFCTCAPEAPRDQEALGEKLASILHDVYGVSVDAPLQVTIGAANSEAVDQEDAPQSN